MQNQNRKKEIIDVCLNQFMETGLFRTTARDLGNALNMKSSALYYYFENKDEIVIACAEEAAIRIEDVLLLPVLNSLGDEKQYRAVAKEKMEESTPMMKFFTQVCTTNEYREAMQPVLDRMKARHHEYAVKLSRQLKCETEDVIPYLAACVAVVANYMVFGENFYYNEPIQLIADAIRTFKKREKKDV